MKNIEVLRLAVEVMKAHNDTCGWKTFKDIKLNEDSENITFVMDFQFMQDVIHITSLFNLTFHVEPPYGLNRKFRIT